MSCDDSQLPQSQDDLDKTDDIIAVFESFDLDRNGMMNRAEFAKVLECLNPCGGT